MTNTSWGWPGSEQLQGEMMVQSSSMSHKGIAVRSLMWSHANQTCESFGTDRYMYMPYREICMCKRSSCAKACKFQMQFYISYHVTFLQKTLLAWLGDWKWLNQSNAILLDSYSVLSRFIITKSMVLSYSIMRANSFAEISKLMLTLVKTAF